MARKKEFSMMEGRIGNVVFYQYNGKQCARVVPQHVNNPRTPAQRLQRAKLQAATYWFQPLVEVVRLGFMEAGRCMCFRRAVSGVLIDATQVTVDQPRIDPALAHVAKGSLTPMEGGEVEVCETSLNLTWQPNKKTPRAQPSDRLVWALYDVETRNVVSNVKIAPKPQRYEGSCTIALPNGLHGSFQLYAFFIDADESRSSDSVWLGCRQV